MKFKQIRLCFASARRARFYYHLEPWILPAIFLGVFLIAAFGYR